MWKTMILLKWVTKPSADNLYLMKKSKNNLQCFGSFFLFLKKKAIWKHNFEQKQGKPNDLFFCQEWSAVLKTSL